MTERKAVTKAEILSGKDYEEKVYIEELKGEITIRPLSERQYAQVQQIKSTATKLVGGAKYDEEGNVDQKRSTEEMKVEVDIGLSQKLDLEANATAVAYSMTTGDNESWTVDEVLNLRPIGIVKKIAQLVYSLSGVTEERAGATKPFRPQQRGTGDRNAAPHRATTGK